MPDERAVPVPPPATPAAKPVKLAGPSKPTEVEASVGYVRPHRDAVVHVVAGKRCPVTILRSDHADFHARTPGILDRITCSTCRVNALASDFVWHGSDEVVGT